MIVNASPKLSIKHRIYNHSSAKADKPNPLHPLPPSAWHLSLSHRVLVGVQKFIWKH